MPVKKKAAPPRKRRTFTPEELYRRLTDLHDRTVDRLHSLSAVHGFGPVEAEAMEAEAAPKVPSSLALDFTDDPSMMRATFVVPPSVAWDMISMFTDHVTEKAKAA